LSKGEGEISSYEAKASSVIVSLLWVEGTTIIEPTMPDIEWHGQLFAIAGVMSYPETAVSYT